MLDFAKRQGNVTLVEALTEAGVRDESPAPLQLRPKPAASVRAAVERSIPALQRADVAFLAERGLCLLPQQLTHGDDGGRCARQGSAG